MDHDVEAPGRVDVETAADADRASTTVVVPAGAWPAAAGGQVPRLRLVQRAVPAGAARPGSRRADRRTLLRLGRAAGRAAGVPRRVLGRRRRRGRRRRGAAAGSPVRHVPRAAGRRPHRAAGDPGQGPDRPRVRRAHASGTPRRSCCRCSTTPCREAAADALRWRWSILDQARDRARTLGLAGAAFPWRTIGGAGVLRLLAGRHRRVPRQRRHRRGGRAATAPSPGTRPCRPMRAGDPGRDGPAVDVARAPRPARAVAHRRRDRAGRVHGDRGRQRLHEPGRGRRTSPRPRTRCAGTRRSPSGSRSPTDEAAAWRDAAEAVHIPYDERAQVHQQSRPLHRPAGVGLRATMPTTRCCCTHRTSTSTAGR